MSNNEKKRCGIIMDGITGNKAVAIAYERLVKILSQNNDVVLVDVSLFPNEKFSFRSFFKNISLLRECDFLLCANVYHVLISWFLIVFSRTKLVFWVQGVVAEESYLKHKSKIRFWILKKIELLTFLMVNALIFASDYMKEFYCSSYSFLSKKNTIVIPCVSDLEVNPTIYREPLSFCYIGGVSAWQRIDWIILYMNSVVINNPSAKFYIASFDVDSASQLVKNIASDELKKVTQIVSLSGKRSVEEFLSSKEYGFLFREDNVVNKVASPIKLAEYLSCGVNVLITESILSYVNDVSRLKIGYVISSAIFEKNKHLSITNSFIFNESAALSFAKQVFSVEAYSNRVLYFWREIDSKA